MRWNQLALAHVQLAETILGNFYAGRLATRITCNLVEETYDAKVPEILYVKMNLSHCVAASSPYRQIALRYILYNNNQDITELEDTAQRKRKRFQNETHSDMICDISTK